MRIRCPECAWRPDGQRHWGCGQCSTAFDTFSTNARCPTCGKTWLETQCIACHEWSLHEDWYDGEHPFLDELVAAEPQTASEPELT